MKTLLFWFGIVFTTTAAAWMIQQKEAILAEGRTVLLELRPRDPRSLMQGDYMVLRYALADQAPKDQLQRRGQLVVKLDGNHVGSFVRLHDATPLAADEQLIAYRSYDGLAIGAESYFFEEGKGSTFDRAKYAELRVAVAGECLLTGLCDEQRQLLKAE